MISFFVDLPTWLIIRVAGIASFVLLTIGVALGISYGLPLWSKKSKAAVYKVHSFATISGTAIGLLHGIFTVIDAYVPYTWKELLVPFSAHYHPVLSGLGTLSGYAMLVVILTTDLRSKLKRTLWLAIHMLSYPIFFMAAIHGYFMGTDSSLPGIRIMYLAAIVLVIGLTFVRSSVKPEVKPQQPLRRRESRAVQSELVAPGKSSVRSDRFRERGIRPSQHDRQP